MPTVVQCRPADCSIRPFKSRFPRSNIYEQLISRTMARARCIQVDILRPRKNRTQTRSRTCYRVTLWISYTYTMRRCNGELRKKLLTDRRWYNVSRRVCYVRLINYVYVLNAFHWNLKTQTPSMPQWS